MKIILVAPFAKYPKGTVMVRMFPIAKQLIKKGHDVSILIPPYDNVDHSGLEYEENGIKFINVFFLDIKIIKHIIIVINMIKRLIKFKPDIIYIFKPKGHSGFVGIISILLRRIGFFQNTKLLLDMDDWEGFGGFNDFYRKHSLYPELLLNFFDLQERWIPIHVDSITVASKELEKRARDLKVPSDKIFYLPNGVDWKKTSAHSSTETHIIKKRLNLTNKKIVLLYTRFFETDLNRLFQIMKEIIGLLENGKILVIGEGEFGEIEILKKMAEKNGIKESVIFTGWIDSGNLSKYLDIGDVAIYPFDNTNLNRAKCPGKLVELMLANKAIIADNVGQIPEYIDNEESGFLINTINPKIFARKVVDVLTNKELLQKVKINAHNKIRKEFNWEVLGKTLEKMIKQLYMKK